MEGKKEFYENRIKKCSDEINELNKKANVLSAVRLLIAVLFLAGLYISYKKNSNAMAVAVIITSAAVFIITALFHSKTLNEVRKKQCYIKVNKKSQDRLDGGWKKFEDTGSEYLNTDHPFADDLDIFGKNSLFQLINSTTTSFGRKKLSDMLLMNKLPQKEEINARQSIVKELASKVDFRQNMEIEGSFDNKGKGDPSEFIEWAKGKNEKLTRPYMKIISILCPLVLIASIIIYFSTYAISKIIPFAMILLNIVVLRLGKNDMAEALNTIYEIKYNIVKYFKIIRIIDNETFISSETNNLKNRLNKNNIKASDAMNELSDICTKISDRSNMIYFLINILLLWDYHLIYRLELWRRKYGSHIEEWFDTIGDFEAFNSISNIGCDHEEYSYPHIEQSLTISAENIAHPLIGERAVSNSFSLERSKSIILITGSNMSGKSTFLRTIGINMVLSYLGSPVYAKKFNTPILHIYTCMRIGDNLEENVSSFYAEILRVKILMNAVKNNEKVFFLLDELFKGTNSMDRHTGAEILLNQLSKKPCLGLLSTHDLELCDLEETNSRVSNYHFKEHYDNNEIKFDYKLRRGKSTTRNAVYLMRMAGIDI